MISIEELYVCRDIRVDEQGVTVEGIGFAHPSTHRHLIVYGQILVSDGLHGEIRYRLVVARFGDESIDVVHEDGFRLKVGRTEPIPIAVWIPVQSGLEPGYYEAVMLLPGGVNARAGFRIE